MKVREAILWLRERVDGLMLGGIFVFHGEARSLLDFGFAGGAFFLGFDWYFFFLPAGDEAM